MFCGELSYFSFFSPIFKEELAVCQGLQDTVGIAIAHRKIGEALNELGKYEAALKHQHEYFGNSNCDWGRHCRTGSLLWVECQKSENNESDSIVENVLYDSRGRFGLFLRWPLWSVGDDFIAVG